MIPYDKVAPKYREEALQRLHERMKRGEKASDILGLDPRYQFYIQKIVDGLVDISYTLYSRIMGCNVEDGIEE